MLWKLRPEHQAACFEVGMNHIGEMRPLVSAIAPTIGTVTNTMRDHQEFLASLEEMPKKTEKSLLSSRVRGSRYQCRRSLRGGMAQDGRE